MAFPEALIVKLDDGLKEFRASLCGQQNKEWHFLTIVLDEMCECVQQVDGVAACREQLVSHIHNGMWREYYPHDQHILAGLIFNGVENLYNELHTHGLYLPCGRLPYHYFPVQDLRPVSLQIFADLLFVKTHELTHSV